MTNHLCKDDPFGQSIVMKTYFAYLLTADRARMYPTWTFSATAERPPRRKPGAYLGQVCVSADGPVTLRRAAGEGARRIYDQSGRERPFASLLPSETHRRAATSNTVEPGGSQDCGWPWSLGRRPAMPRHTSRLNARVCHLTYTWSGRCWIASISFLHGRHINIK